MVTGEARIIYKGSVISHLRSLLLILSVYVRGHKAITTPSIIQFFFLFMEDFQNFQKLSPNLCILHTEITYCQTDLKRVVKCQGQDHFHLFFFNP